MWFWWSILASILSALVIALTKKALADSGASLVTWALFSLNTPLLVLIAFKNGPTQVNYIYFLGAIASSVVFSIAKTLRLSGIKQGLLSKISSLSTLSVVFAYLLALVFLSENVQLLEIIGLILITIGAYILNLEKLGKDFFKTF